MRLTIDLGGTNIRIAWVENGRCLKKISVPCLAQAEASVVLGQLVRLIGDMMNEQVDGIGIGVPSIVHPENGIVYNVANIPSWRKVHLKDVLQKEFGVSVAVNNDSNCFALGESRFGKGRPYSDMVGITIGTGIGAGVIVNHRLYGGRYMGAGEIGSFPYLDADFEHYCSSFFFKRHNTTSMEVAEKANQGYTSSLQLWYEFGLHLGNLMKVILYAYAPQAIVLGGGIASSFPLFESAMKEGMRDFPYKVIAEAVEIVTSQEEDASLLGASVLPNT